MNFWKLLFINCVDIVTQNRRNEATWDVISAVPTCPCESTAGGCNMFVCYSQTKKWETREKKELLDLLQGNLQDRDLALCCHRHPLNRAICLLECLTTALVGWDRVPQFVLRIMQSAVVRGVSEKVRCVRHVERQLYVIVTFQGTTRPKLYLQQIYCNENIILYICQCLWETLNTESDAGTKRLRNLSCKSPVNEPWLYKMKFRVEFSFAKYIS